MVAITWRTTHLRTRENDNLVIPNGKLADAELHFTDKRWPDFDAADLERAPAAHDLDLAQRPRGGNLARAHHDRGQRRGSARDRRIGPEVAP